MIYWCESRREFEDFIDGVLKWQCVPLEREILNYSRLRGFCVNCNKVSNFSSPILDYAPGGWKNLLEGMICECGLNGRMRMILNIVDDLDIGQEEKLVIFERFTPIYEAIKKRFENVLGCEYLGTEHSSGQVVQFRGESIQHENLLNLSFADNSIDLLMHFDVLEHIPDPRHGLLEIYRVLRNGGRMIFTCPFFHNLEENIVRSRVVDGEIKHLLPNAYHGNPISNEGSLVYIHPSWEVIDWLREIGYSKVKFGINYSPLEGIFSNGCPYPDGHMYPLAIIAAK